MAHVLWRRRVGEPEEFDAWLESEPVLVDEAEERLMRAFGLRQ